MYKKSYYVTTTLTALLPIIGLLALETLGGGIFNGFAASKKQPEVMSPETIIAMTGALAIFGICVSAYNLFLLWRGRAKGRVGMVVVFCLALLSATVVLWVWAES